MKIFKSFLGALILIQTGCSPFQDSPFSDQIFHSARNLNQTAISSLGDIESDGKVRIALITDTHQNYKELDKVIFEVNKTPDLDFLAHLGDFTNSAYNFEYDQFLDHYLYVKIPALTVFGNHDAIGSGPSLYSKVFGNPNFYFESNSYRFIFFNSCNLENPSGFNPQWLLDTVQASLKPVLIFSHVPLTDAERYQGNTAAIFAQVVNHGNTKAIMNGHNHVYAYGSSSGTHLVQTPRVQSLNWLVLEIQGTQMDIIQMSSGAIQGAPFKP